MVPSAVWHAYAITASTTVLLSYTRAPSPPRPPTPPPKQQPQGQDGEVRWVLYQLGFILLGLLGVVGVCVSLMWIIHIVIYMLPPVPIHPMLNEVFMKLDAVFPLFGVAAFSAFCCYLMGARRREAGPAPGAVCCRLRVEEARPWPVENFHPGLPHSRI